MVARWTLPVLLLGSLAGCSGEYILTAADAVALPGRPVPVVVRLQRREFWFYCPPVRDAAITFRGQDGRLKCARTDKQGYAAVSFPAPKAPGSYTLALHLQDTLGYSASGQVRVFVLPPDRPVILVDADSLPDEGDAAGAAAQAIGRLAKGACIVYLTEARRGTPGRAREILAALGCPPGPVVGWRRRPSLRRRLGRKPPAPGVLASLKHRLPRLTCAVTADPVAVEALRAAKLKVCLVGVPGRVQGVQHVESWAALKLPADGRGE